MTIKNIKKNKGFVILFSVVLSSAIFALALGVASISFKEIKFGTITKETNSAFFAADTGAECALYHDGGAINRFISPDLGGQIACAGTNITPVFSGDTNAWAYNFTIINLGNTSQGCAKVTINKTPTTTSIISKGYNNGGSSCTQGSSSVERQIELNY